MAISFEKGIITYGAMLLAVTLAASVSIWTIGFWGGLSWRDESLVFNNHPFLMLIGPIISNALGFIFLRAFQLRDRMALLIHVLMHTLAFVLGILGAFAAFKSQELLDMPHLYSVHSCFGIAIIVAYGILLIYSIARFLFPELVRARDCKGRIEVLLRCKDKKQELGRIYGLVRYLLPARIGNIEILNDPSRITGDMRFFPDSKEKLIAGHLNLYEPDALEEMNPRLIYGTSCFLDAEHCCGSAPVNEESMINSIESFKGTLELTHKGSTWHALIGAVVFLMGVGNAAVGLLNDLEIPRSFSIECFQTDSSETYLVYAILTLTVFYALLVCLTLCPDTVTLDVETYTDSRYNPPKASNTDDDDDDDDVKHMPGLT